MPGRVMNRQLKVEWRTSTKEKVFFLVSCWSDSSVFRRPQSETLRRAVFFESKKGVFKHLHRQEILAPSHWCFVSRPPAAANHCQSRTIPPSAETDSETASERWR